MNDRHAISPYPIRMPAELREMLEASAREGSRSLHAEIISRLWTTFSKQDLVRHKLGLPLAEPEEDGSEEDLYPGVNERSEDETHHFKPSGVSKEKLTSALGEQVTDKEHLLLTAMLDALRKIEDPAAWEAAQPSKGPKPRKRFPKE